MTSKATDRPRPAGRQLSAGLPDEAFVTDGLLTKRVLRAYALAMLAPRAGERLWDLGAGTGSIGIEWCLLHPDNTAVAVERNADRVQRILQNAGDLGVGGQLRVVTGGISDSLGTLGAAPDAVFIGGGVDNATLRTSWELLPSGGRLVVHSVTAESDVVLLAAHTEWGGELTRVAVESAEPIGRLTGFKPARTVTTFAAVKA
ncbi:MAG TPA: precorrin-6Y C5,15-methyltransferase (decarboxylating) subunit CbiT [Propionicimonas sp.]|jgi:precorrin-6Y C5,15-methyltransferase (decarboxylating)|uniref:precorrin-6Y C5,15-methyltransferase (decarboxylating) subunit CbiT n=1 Tax=Propionicimonas sp. TaxID=1955623 RepID=UPI002F411A40